MKTVAKENRLSHRYSYMKYIALASALIAVTGCASGPSQSAVAPGAEKRIQVCTVDPIAPGGMMTIAAIHSLTTNDTLVMQSKGRVPIAKVVGGPKVLSQASFVSAKQPLQLTTSAGRVRYAPAGKPAAFAPGKIMLIGSVKGLPVYALPADAGRLRPEVEALEASGSDLEQALQKRVALRRNMERVRTLYVPTALVGCKFQRLARVQAPSTKASGSK